MDRKYKVGGYVKLAKLWERSKDAAVAYHSSYYAEKFKDDADKRLVGVYIDITGNKEIYKRPEMVHLLKDCKQLFLTGHICLIITDIFGYQHLIIQRTDTYHKKFIQIRRGNRNKLQAFQQRRRFDCSFLQYAQVKFQPTQFTVKKIFRFVQIYAFHLFTHPF